MKGNGLEKNFAMCKLLPWRYVPESRSSYNCVIYYQDQTWHRNLIARTGFWVSVHCGHNLGDMTLGQGHDTPLGHGQQLWEIISRFNLAVRSYGPDFRYLCTVTLTLEI